MREWNISKGDPLSMILVSDARLGPTDYQDDQIWELTFGRGEPSAITLQTTFGLRARVIRIFPRFCEKDTFLTDPSDFHKYPVVRRIYPNYIDFNFSPFSLLDVEAEYWVPENHAIAGRYTITNLHDNPRSIVVELVGQLNPNQGQRMAPVEFQAAPVLMGQTENIYPVIFLTGETKFGAGSFPSLVKTFTLDPGESKQITWIHTALESPDASFEFARQAITRKWDSERTYLDMLNSGQLEIYTGEPDWDIVFMLSLKTALSLVAGPTDNLPYPSFVINRRPDQGFSLRKNGSDYNHLWNGQPAIESYHLANLMLPGYPKIALGLLLNYLAIQGSDGAIDWKPGLGGQRSYILSTPILATLAMRIYDSTQDRVFLEQVYPGLLSFFKTWFLRTHDRDGDGIPEWDHPIQSGSEDHPTYSRWNEWSRGQEINCAEGPALNAFLFRECRSLITIADLIAHHDDIPALESISSKLKNTTESYWDETSNSYLDVDRDTHLSSPLMSIAEQDGPGTITLSREFTDPVRLVIKINTSDGLNRRPRMEIYGSSSSTVQDTVTVQNTVGQPGPEIIPEEKFKWYLGKSIFTTNSVYSKLDRIDIQGLNPSDRVVIYSAGYDLLELSQLLPLWAGIPDSQRARLLVERTIVEPSKYWLPAGLPTSASPASHPEAQSWNNVNIILSSMVGEGLIEYGYRHHAAELVKRMMNSIISNLKQNNAFFRNYSASTGQGIGEKDAITGLAPINLFLETLGVQIFSDQRIALAGFNPFPWPVTVKYRGLTILRLKEQTSVLFPDGQTVSVTDPDPKVISLG